MKSVKLLESVKLIHLRPRNVDYQTLFVFIIIILNNASLHSFSCILYTRVLVVADVIIKWRLNRRSEDLINTTNGFTILYYPILSQIHNFYKHRLYWSENQKLASLFYSLVGRFPICKLIVSLNISIRAVDSFDPAFLDVKWIKIRSFINNN